MSSAWRLFAVGLTIVASVSWTASAVGAERTVLTRSQLFGSVTPPSPVDDTAGFAMPADAAAPTEVFEGGLTLGSGGARFTLHSDVFAVVPEGDSAWKRLPPFAFRFVQQGTHLIPKVQGLAITGSPAWNYIVGPGRVWQEPGDDGYMRAALPFALVQRNQNCVHNGALTFLFSHSKSPQVSNVYYQVTQETCYPMKFDLWGVVTATWAPGPVPEADALRENHAAELGRRLPTRPLAALATDFPAAAFDVEALARTYDDPEQITTHGLVVGGVHYASGCPTRFGEYAFCEDMRLPSYSIAKSVFTGVALMRLGQLYGAQVYDERIRDHVAEHWMGGNWETTTFAHASDMATGNFDSDAYEADEYGPAMATFIVAESYPAKIAGAFVFDESFAAPGTRWVYQSSTTFLVTQAMNAFLKQRQGRGADLFDMLRDDVLAPLGVSAGGLTTIRTDNSTTGAPTGYYGMFFSKDDIARIGGFLNAGTGTIAGTQVLDANRLNEALFRTSDAASAGVPILGTLENSALGAPRLGSGKPRSSNTRRYAHGFWGRHITAAEFPQHACDFWVALMAGYGGNIVLLLPNGVVTYAFSDGMEFPWVDSVDAAATLAPFCG